MLSLGRDAFAKETPDLGWSKNFGGSINDYFESVIEVSDGGLVAVGYSRSTDIEGLTSLGEADAIMVKYDSNGNKIWAKSFGGSNTDYFYSVIETNDGGLVAVGNSYVSNIEGLTNLGSYDAIIVKFDSSGNKVWAKNFGGTKDDSFNSVIETNDGGLVVVGYTLSTDIEDLTALSTTSYRDAIIVKYDSNGNKIWAKSFGGSREDEFYSVIETNNGGLVAVGYSYSTNIEGLTNLGNSDTTIVKYDSLGNQLWVKNFGGSNSDYFKSVIETNNGGLVAVGYSNSSNISEFSNLGSVDAIIVKYDSSGKQVWAKNFGGSDFDYFYSVIETNDGGLVAVGNSFSTDIEGLTALSTTSYRDAIIVKYNIEYIIEPESTSKIMNTYLIPDNTLKLSLNTDSIIFNNFSYTESAERLNILELTVSSTLLYNIKVSIDADIVGSTYGEEIDKSIFNIKSSSANSYQTFSESITSLTLLQNQPIGNDVVHSIDMKLSSNKMNRVDVYKTVLKFEVEQI